MYESPIFLELSSRRATLDLDLKDFFLFSADDLS